MKRLAMLCAAALMGLAAAPSSFAASAADCPKGGTVRFGVEPYEAMAVMTPLYHQMGELLAKKLGCKVKIFIATSYTAEIEALRHGKLDIAEVGPFGYELSKKEVPGLTADAQFGTAEGKPVSYWASIVTWKGSGIHDLKQVRGKTFAYSDPASTSGHLMPAYGLKSAGINPKTGIRALYAGTHTASFEALRNHKVEAGEFNSLTLPLALSKGWYKKGEFTTLWRSEQLPLDAIVVQPQLPTKLRKHLIAELRSFQFSPPMNPKAFKIMGYAQRMVPASDATYAYIAKVMKTMGMDKNQ